jgi:hypothetical protein
MGLKLAQITSIHDSVATWWKGLKELDVITIYPTDMSTPSMSMTCPAVTVESSMSFKAVSGEGLPWNWMDVLSHGGYNI